MTCEHYWAEHSYTVSARVQRGAAITFVVTNARLQRCDRCEVFLLRPDEIGRHLFRAEPSEIRDLLIRLADEGPPSVV